MKGLQGNTDKELTLCKERLIELEREVAHLRHNNESMKSSSAFVFGTALRRAIQYPGKNTLALPVITARIFAKAVLKRVKYKLDTHSSKTSNAGKKIRDAVSASNKISQFVEEKRKNTTIVLMASDVNLNVVDGSSVWVSSTINVLSAEARVIFVSREILTNDHITSNIDNLGATSIILEPADFGLNRALNHSETRLALNALDNILPNVPFLIVRGLELADKIMEDKSFKGRLVPYVTNFYTPSKTGIGISESAVDVLCRLESYSFFWLWQTNQIKEKIHDLVQASSLEGMLYPPVLPDAIEIIDEGELESNSASSFITVGYAGKIQPDWAVLELLEEADRLHTSGFPIKVLIISNKISARSNVFSSEGFVNRINELLSRDFVEQRKGLNRSQSISALQAVDYIWCFRRAEFENNTLELSTKLLEAIALAKPAICYPSEINRELLGAGYSYFLESIEGLGAVLKSENGKSDLLALSKNTTTRFGTSARQDVFKQYVKNGKMENVVFASHDFKFVDSFFSHLKNKRYKVVKDFWDWGKSDSNVRSEELFQNADVIFCEWGLAAAVWYSKRNTVKKPLFVRIHAQEVRARAAGICGQIKHENVTGFIFVSEHIRKEAIELWGWPVEKTHVVYNYVESDESIKSDKAPSAEACINIGMVGITPRSKRLDRALTMLELLLLRLPNAKLYIKGTRPEEYEWMHAPSRTDELTYYKQQYKRIEDSELLSGAVIFDGFGHDMRKWYSKIDVIISPSDNESFHYGLADGMVNGCSPVIWNWRGASELYNGFGIVDSVGQAVNLIEEYCARDSKEKERQCEMHRHFIIDNYGEEHIFEKLEELMF